MGFLKILHYYFINNCKLQEKKKKQKKIRFHRMLPWKMLCLRVLDAISLAATLPQLPLPTIATLYFSATSAFMDVGFKEKLEREIWVEDLGWVVNVLKELVFSEENWFCEKLCRFCMLLWISYFSFLIFGVPINRKM